MVKQKKDREPGTKRGDRKSGKSNENSSNKFSKGGSGSVQKTISKGNKHKKGNKGKFRKNPPAIAMALAGAKEFHGDRESKSAFSKQKQLKDSNHEASNNPIQKKKKKGKEGEAPSSKKAYINKQRIKVFCARGVTSQFRHLMCDVRDLIPHSKKEAKFDEKKKMRDEINEVCEIDNCNGCVFFEARKLKDLYLWISRTPNGPSANFLVSNIHTTAELRMTGNCLKGSRPLLVFDDQFDTEPYLQLLKELFQQTFGTPAMHPKSKPFIDHVISFHYLDHRIWFRNFQIIWGNEDQSIPELAEIGPRFVLQPIRIFAGSFGGETLYQNPYFLNPNKIRTARKVKTQLSRQQGKMEKKEKKDHRKGEVDLPVDPIANVFREKIQ